jgi:ferredoxin-NADP reductase
VPSAPHAVRRPAATRSRGLRRLLQPFVAAEVFDFWARSIHPTLAWDRILARVVEHRRESADAVTLVLKPNGNFAGFLPGQHVNVSLEIDGVRVTRAYSLTDVPRADGLLSLTVKRMTGGRVSGELCERTRVGTVLELGPAFGDMTLPRQLQAPLLLAAAGSGITPLMSLLRSLAAQGMPVATTLLYWTARRDERCFAAELAALSARFPRLQVHYLLTREAASGADESEGRAHAEQLAHTVPDLAQRRVYACGPAGFVETLRALTADRAAHFQAEAFTLPELTADAGGVVRVHLARSGRTLELPRGRPLLSSLEENGLQPVYGCRMGICNTCACGKLDGRSQNLRTGSRSDEPEQALKLCISGPCSDMTLDL